MYESINSFDKYLFELINQGGRNALFDLVMPVLSGSRYVAVPAAVLWVMLVLRKNVKKRIAAIQFGLIIGKKIVLENKISNLGLNRH